MAIRNGHADTRCIRQQVSIPSLSPSPISALIDTGATDSFFSKSLLCHEQRRQVGLQYLSQPVPLFLLDGTASRDSIQAYITPVITCLPYGPSIELRLFEAALSSDVQVLLGMDFLDIARPEFDWDNHCLLFPDGSDYDSDLPIEASTILTNTEESSTSRRHDLRQATTRPANPTSSQSPVSEVDSSFIFDPEEEPDDIADILRVVPSTFHEYLDVFSKARAEKLPPHRSYDHSVELIDVNDLPAVGPIYSTSAIEAQALKSEIDGMLAKGFIRPSTAPIGAPVLFVKKKDTSLRMCIDYRQLNLRTKKNKYPLPPINFLLEQLAGAKVFTKIDLRGAYHLLRIADGDEWKTTFRCRYGSFEFLVMPFGLTNAPSAFQHLINDVLRPHLDRFVIAYLDDILIYSANVADHPGHVRTVLECLRSANLYAKATKCGFNLEETDFLGYIVGKDGLKMDPGKIQTILDWPKPSNVKAVQSFLGFANFYRRFIRDYSKIIGPFTALTRKDIPYNWSPECHSAFEDLKQRFTSAPILLHFDPEAPTYLETDASDYAMGTILSQQGADGLLLSILESSCLRKSTTKSTINSYWQ